MRSNENVQACDSRLVLVPVIGAAIDSVLDHDQRSGCTVQSSSRTRMEPVREPALDRIVGARTDRITWLMSVARTSQPWAANTRLGGSGKEGKKGEKLRDGKRGQTLLDPRLHLAL